MIDNDSMLRRTVVIVIALGAASAHAQPQEQQPPVSSQAPGMQPPPTRPSVMDKRWAIGIGVGPESYQAHVDGAPKVEFGQLELAGRYRIRTPIELGLALHLGGSNHIGEGGLFVDFRYRFMAEQKLDVYALASLGVLSVAHEDASETEKKGRGALRLGAGGEYRWNWFALALELRLVGVGENKNLAAMPMETVGYQLARSKLSGGSLALGANFYF